MINWNNCRRKGRRVHYDGSIDLVVALNELPDVDVRDFDYVAACDYLLTVESISQITSEEIAASILGVALEIGYRTCRTSQKH